MKGESMLLGADRGKSQQTSRKHINCYRCACSLLAEEAVRRPKARGGEVLIWCRKCHRNTFYKRPKFIKRERG
jgi:predicted SprT family Zn-dependent metalloprotease